MKINFYEHNLKETRIIKEVLNSTYLTTGPICQKVEKKITNIKLSAPDTIIPIIVLPLKPHMQLEHHQN